MDEGENKQEEKKKGVFVCEMVVAEDKNKIVNMCRVDAQRFLTKKRICKPGDQKLKRAQLSPYVFASCTPCLLWLCVLCVASVNHYTKRSPSAN